MKLSKVLTAVGVIAACTSVFGAESTRDRSFGPIGFGAELETSYLSNVNASTTDKSGSFLLQLRPYMTFDFKGSNMDLALNYNPEYRWYEHRPEGQDQEWDHNLGLGYTYRISPSLAFNVYDRYSKISNSSDAYEVGGSTTIAGQDNNYWRNTLGSKFTWDTSEAQKLTFGYENRVVDFRNEGSAAREVKTDEFTAAIDRKVSDKLTLGAMYLYRFDNFHNSDITFPGTTQNVTRDSSLQRLAATGVYSISGLSKLSIKAGGDYRKATDHTLEGVDETELFPYFSATLNWSLPRNCDVALGYTYQTITSSKSNIYFAGQHKVAASLTKQFSEKLSFNTFASYERNAFDSSHSRNNSPIYDDNEEWLRVGFNFIYTIRQNLDLKVGYTRNHLKNSAFGADNYELNDYNVGVLYKF